MQLPQAADLKWMLEQGYSVNLYMFHGGTSFGWMNGADMDDGKYKPDVTSYDYDAPVSESGELTPKFYLFRDAIREATGKTPPAPPAPIPARALCACEAEGSGFAMEYSAEAYPIGQDTFNGRR